MISTAYLHHRRWASRWGFTLVELLVVLAIVLIILALTSAAAIQVMAYQRGSVTQMTLKTLSDSLNRQLAPVIDAAKRETIPPDINNLAMMGASAGNQNIEKRARVIWIKLRLKQEFPMNVSEALYPGAVAASLYSPPYSPPISLTTLPARVSYAQILRNAGYYVPAANESATAAWTIPASVRPPTLPPAIPTPATWPEESSICLLMALQQGRNGPALTADDLGSGMVTTDPISGLKMLVDAWQQPVYFYRWQGTIPYEVDPVGDPGNQNNRDMDNSAPVGPLSVGNPKTVYRDPLDPEGVLLDPDWNNVTNFTAGSGVWWFELYCHPVHEILGTVYFARSYYTVPVVVSGGRNTRRGLIQMGSTLAYSPQVGGLPAVPLNLFPSPLLPDLMDVDPADPEGANDNIYSYRLRQGARGD